METTILPLPWWILTILLVIATVAVIFYGIREENKGWRTAKNRFYGKLLEKENLVIGMHYKILSIATAIRNEGETKPTFVFLIVNGKRRPDDEENDFFGINMTDAMDIFDKEGNLIVKEGDTIAKTMEGNIIVMR